MAQNYEYSADDLLKNPQKYQMTKYIGSDFLIIYKIQRNKIIKILNQQNPTLEEIMNEFISLDSIESLYKNTSISLSKLLSILISQYYTLQNDDLFLKILNKLIKKFEIQKKLYSTYDLDFKEISTSFNDLFNYEKLSLLVLLQYDKTKNLKFLNVALKINDTLSSQIHNINQKNEKLLMTFILKLELEYITKLCNIKGIL